MWSADSQYTCTCTAMCAVTLAWASAFCSRQAMPQKFFPKHAACPSDSRPPSAGHVQAKLVKGLAARFADHGVRFNAVHSAAAAAAGSGADAAADSLARPEVSWAVLIAVQPQRILHAHGKARARSAPPAECCRRGMPRNVASPAASRLQVAACLLFRPEGDMNALLHALTNGVPLATCTTLCSSLCYLTPTCMPGHDSRLGPASVGGGTRISDVRRGPGDQWRQPGRGQLQLAAAACGGCQHVRQTVSRATR